MEEENQPESSYSVEPCGIAYPCDTVVLVEQSCEQQDESNKASDKRGDEPPSELVWRGQTHGLDHRAAELPEVTEPTATITVDREVLTISDEVDNGYHERDDGLQRTDEDSQCNVYRSDITSVTVGINNRDDEPTNEEQEVTRETGPVITNDKLTEKKFTLEHDRGTSQDHCNWERVRQEVICAICLELLDDPKSMPCLHTYCKKCLMEAIAKQSHNPDLPQDRLAINCPLCRAEVTLPDKGIEGLPSNFSAMRLVETVQLQDKFEQNKTQKCDSCIEGDAIASCCECGGFFLCKNCLNVHKKLPSTKTHSMLSLSQLVQLDTAVTVVANKSLLCLRHPQEPLKLYCEDCETLVCRDCVLVRHKMHNYNFVDDIIEEEKEHLQDVTLEELAKILTSTKKAITGVEQMQAKVLSCNDQHVAQLNKTFREITDMLNNRKTTFLVEVHQITKDDLCPLQKQQEDLVTLKEKIKSCNDFTQKTLHNGTSTEIMSAKKQMLERTKHLQDLHSSSPMAPVIKPSTTVLYQMDKIKEVVNSLGVVIDLQQSSLKDIPEKIYIGDAVCIKAVLKDTRGQPVCSASKAITAEVTVDNNPVTSQVLESGDGKYSMTFTPTRCKNHIVSIKVNGRHISGSPTELQIDSDKVAAEANCNTTKLTQDFCAAVDEVICSKGEVQRNTCVTCDFVEKVKSSEKGLTTRGCTAVKEHRAYSTSSASSPSENTSYSKMRCTAVKEDRAYSTSSASKPSENTSYLKMGCTAEIKNTAYSTSSASRPSEDTPYLKMGCTAVTEDKAYSTSSGSITSENTSYSKSHLYKTSSYKKPNYHKW